SHGCGKVGAVCARAQYPDRDVEAFTWNGAYQSVFIVCREVFLEFLYISFEIHYGTLVAAKCLRGRLVCPGCAAKPEVDSVREKRGECSELLGHYQRRVIG